MQGETRVCSRCGEEKLVSKQFLPKGKICWDCREVAIKVSNVNWRAAHKEELKDKREHWTYLNPDKPTQYSASRRAAKLMAKGVFTQDDVRLVKEAQSGLCVYCRCTLGSSYHVDHIFPISKHFYNGPENIQLLCGTCNSRKRDEDPYLHEKKLGLSGIERTKQLDQIKSVILAAHEGVSLEILHKEWRNLARDMAFDANSFVEEEFEAYKAYRHATIREFEDYRKEVCTPEPQSPFYEPRHTYEMWGHT